MARKNLKPILEAFQKANQFLSNDGLVKDQDYLFSSKGDPCVIIKPEVEHRLTLETWFYVQQLGITILNKS